MYFQKEEYTMIAKENKTMFTCVLCNFSTLFRFGPTTQMLEKIDK